MNRKMFELNETITEAVDRLMAEYGDQPRGTVVSHDEIAEVSGIGYMTLHWSGTITRWRKRMLKEKQIELIGERGVGYAFATIDRQVNEMADRRQWSAVRQYNRAATACRVIDDATMTPRYRQIRQARLQYLASVKAAAMEALKGQEQACYSPTPISVPKRPINITG